MYTYMYSFPFSFLSPCPPSFFSMNILFLNDIKTLRLVYVITNKYMSIEKKKGGLLER